MSRAARVKFSVEDYTQNVKSPSTGISFVLGQSLRGPFANPSDIINSWPKFVEIYGGLSDVSDAPLLARRILEKGGSIRFSRVGHYTDVTDSTTLTALKAAVSPVISFELDGPLLVGNEIDVTVNGQDMATVTFATSSNVTMQNLAAALKALTPVKDVIVIETAGVDTTELYIVPQDNVVLLNVSAVTITGGSSQPTDSLTNINLAVDRNSGRELFELVLKNPGLDGNNFLVVIGNASNGDARHFSVSVKHKTDASINEFYDNLIIDSNKTVGNSTYLRNIIEASSYIDVIYKDLSNSALNFTPVKGISFNYTGGTDGGVLLPADYVGDSAQKNGLFAFDNYDEALEMAVLDNYSDVVNLAGAEYATNRKDLQFIVHLPIELRTKSSLIAKRDTLAINTKYAFIVSGGIQIFDPITSQKVNKSEHADVVALASKSAQDFGPWYSFAGLRRGLLSGILGVVNNFGTPATYNDLNDLANKQINMVVTKNGENVLWGNHSAQLASNQQSFNNIVRLVIYLQKALKPTLETFLEEPNDIPTWSRIYYTVKPFLDSLVNNRAIYSYEWLGDQNASSLNDLVINNSNDVSDGKYKINLVIGAIPGINEIEVAIMLTKAGVSFEEVSSLS